MGPIAAIILIQFRGGSGVQNLASTDLAQNTEGKAVVPGVFFSRWGYEWG